MRRTLFATAVAAVALCSPSARGQWLDASASQPVAGETPLLGSGASPSTPRESLLDAGATPVIVPSGLTAQTYSLLSLYALGLSSYSAPAAPPATPPISQEELSRLAAEYFTNGGEVTA